jgi:glycosyltransferase involved in cell wall biosynthesis
VASAPVAVQLLEKLVVGGAENLAVRVAGVRAASDLPSLVYALQGGGALGERLPADVVLRELGIGRSSVRWPPAFAASVWRGRRILLDQLAADRVDVVQTHLPEANFWGLLLARSGRVGVVATVHNNLEFHYGDDDGPLRRALRRRAYRAVIDRCDAVVTVSAAVRDSLVAALDLPARAADRLVVVPNGVAVPPPREGVREAVRRELDVPADEPLLLGAGRLTAQKNFGDLVDLAAGLRDRGVAANTIIAGEGEDRPALEARVVERGLAGRVRLLGVRDDLDRLLQAADLFVLSSRWEGLPLVLLEAMAARCPVAGYAIAGTRDVIDDGRHGVLAPVGDVSRLTALVADLLADPARRERMGREARTLVRDHHDIDQVVARLNDLYADVADRRRRHG